MTHTVSLSRQIGTNILKSLERLTAPVSIFRYDDLVQKAERLMAITLLLQSRGKMTAEQLADLLSVSVRTIYRDMNSLSLAHVPVSMDYGPGGGYFLSDDARVGPVSFTGEEAMALAVGGAMAGGSRLFGGNERLHQALIKLEASLPQEYRKDVQAARERVLVDVAAWYRHPSTSPFLEPVRGAVWAERQLRLLYRGADEGDTAWRLVDPLGLVCKDGIWYLVAYCYRREDFRTFRLSRILQLETLEEPVTPRPDFDLKRYWEEARRHFEAMTMPLSVMLRISPDILERMEGAFTILGEEEDGSAVAQIDLDSVDVAVSYVLSLGPDVTVLDPAEVRDGVARTAHAIAARYQDA